MLRDPGQIDFAERPRFCGQCRTTLGPPFRYWSVYQGEWCCPGCYRAVAAAHGMTVPQLDESIKAEQRRRQFARTTARLAELDRLNGRRE